MTRNKRIALALWRRRKPLMWMFPWKQHADGRREVLHPQAANIFMQQQLHQLRGADAADWMRWMGAIS